MRLGDLVARGAPALSLEFFPPRLSQPIVNPSVGPVSGNSVTGNTVTGTATNAVGQTDPGINYTCNILSDTEAMITELAGYSPDFMTVTYGAGGGSRSLTQHLVNFIHAKLGIPSVAHLVCAGHSVAEIDAILSDFRRMGISRVLALRGDPPKGSREFKPHPEGFSCAEELTKHITTKGGFDVAVAGYPEVHRDAISPEADLVYLKKKIDAGAGLIITQLFFDNSCYFRFVEKCRKVGIGVPILPGVMPVANVSQVKRFTSMCGASIPTELGNSLQKLEDRPELVVQFGIDYAAKQCQELLQGGAPGIHLYTLNRSTQVVPVVNFVFGCRKHREVGAVSPSH